MAINKEELLSRLNEVTDKTSAADARDLFNDLSDYLNDMYNGPQPWDDSTGDVTPEYASWEKKALEDLGLEESIFDTLNALQETGSINKDDNDSLVIGGTDIFKEPFTEEQLAILRKDSAYSKLIKDELAAIQADDIAKLKNIHDAQTKRARELLESSGDKPHDKKLAGEKTPEEDFMQRAVEGKVPATSGVLAGDLTPEEIEMIQMMRAGKQSKDTGLADSQTLSDERFKNVTNRLAKNLSKHRW